MPRDLRVSSVDELPPGQARLVEEGALQVAVFNTGGAYYATDNLCSHRQSPLNEGFLEGYLITCLAHGVNADADCRLIADPVCPPIADHFVL